MTTTSRPNNIVLKILLITCISLALGAGHLLAASLGTAFTYQGRLSTGANAANGIYDIQIGLWNAGSGPSQVGSTLTLSGVGVTNGLFTANLDFGASAFDGTARWLELSVRTNGAVAYTTLAPRQSLTPAPYALVASNISGTLPAAQLTGTLPSGLLSGTYGSVVNFNNPGSAFAGNGGGLTNLNASTLCGMGCNMFWNLLGNAGTTPGLNFLGTTDNKALELKVNGLRAFRLEPTSGAPNVIGGSSANSSGNFIGVTIGGGDQNVATASFGSSHFATIGGGNLNTVDGSTTATIGGGAGNIIEFSLISGASTSSVISGGSSNLIFGHAYCTIGGGLANLMRTGNGSSDYSTIGGGQGNIVGSDQNPNATGATIGGGMANIVDSPGGTIAGGNANAIYGDDVIGRSDDAFIGGGARNLISQESWGSSIGGGLSNHVDIFSEVGTIAGGQGNSVAEHASFATIGGGQSNLVASDFGIVAGGATNSATNQYSSVVGGSRNTAGGIGAAVGGGELNFALADYATIGGGVGNFMVSGVPLGSAVYSVIGGGASNSITGDLWCTIGGGARNIIRGNPGTADSATIGGGQGNVIGDDTTPSATGATIAGGVSNIVSAPWGTIAGGFANFLIGDDLVGRAVNGFIGGGASNRISQMAAVASIVGGGNNSVDIFSTGATIGGGVANHIQVYNSGAQSSYGAIGGGLSNIVNVPFGTVPGGAQAVARNYGQMAYASGQFASAGDAQSSVYVCRGTTSDATQTELFLDGVGQRMIMQTNSTWTFDVLITGRASNGNSAGYSIKGTIRNNNGVLSIVQAPAFPSFQSLGEDVLAWDSSVAPDSSHQAFTVRVIGAAATSIRWVATVRTVEVIF
jgi:hypothetical protein